MTQDDDQIKGLLGRAFGAEPPLNIDRDEIFRRGRRQVRARRFAASGGVAAAVVAVVLGAATLSNLPAEDAGPGITPGEAASTRPPYPPTSPPAGETPSQGPPQLPISSTTVAPKNRHADELTQVLADARLIPTNVVMLGPDTAVRPLAFIFFQEKYQATADLRHAQSTGNILVQLARKDPAGRALACGDLTGRFDSCSVETGYGLPMLAATERSATGTIRYVVHAIRADGTDVLVTSNNLTTNPDGAVVAGSKPPIDIEVLKRIAALPRLVFG